MIDAIDKKILHELAKDSRLSVERIAEKVNLSATPVRRRIKHLEHTGVIQRYSIDIDMSKCGFSQRMYVHIKLKSCDQKTIAQFEERIQALAEITVCNLITGGFDYILEIQAVDMAQYSASLHQSIADLPGVFGIETSVVVNAVKNTPFLPYI